MWLMVILAGTKASFMINVSKFGYKPQLWAQARKVRFLKIDICPFRSIFVQGLMTVTATLDLKHPDKAGKVTFCFNLFHFQVLTIPFF